MQLYQHVTKYCQKMAKRTKAKKKRSIRIGEGCVLTFINLGGCYETASDGMGDVGRSGLPVMWTVSRRGVKSGGHGANDDCAEVVLLRVKNVHQVKMNNLNGNDEAMQIQKEEETKYANNLADYETNVNGQRG